MFFAVHVLGSVSFLVAAWFHVRHVRVYVYEAGLVYLWVLGQRWYSRERVAVEMKIRVDRTSSSPAQDEKGEMVEITFDLPARKMMRHVPGSHVYVSIAASTVRGALATFLRPANPFTVASVSSKVHMSKPTQSPVRQATLILRAMSGTTKELARIARTAPAGKVSLDIEGPYGSAQYLPDLSDVEKFPRVLLVAGGVGATFTLPIYKDLLETRGGKGVKFIWCVRHKQDAEWGRKLLGVQAAELGKEPDMGWVWEENTSRGGKMVDPEDMVPVEEGAGIFVTSKTSPEITPDTPTVNPEARPSMSREGGSIELEEHSNLLQTPEAFSTPRNPRLGYYSGRPGFRAVFAGMAPTKGFGEGEAKLAVLVCGPKALARDLRDALGWWVRRSKVDAFWHEEGFGWG